MADYQKMYAVLCGAVDNVIARLESKYEVSEEAGVLTEAMCRAEDIYIESSDCSENN